MGTEKIQGVIHESAISSLHALAPPFREGNLTFVKDHCHVSVPGGAGEGRTKGADG